MPNLTAQERLQPSLLDRLTDDASGTTTESREQRVFSIDRLRQTLLRDLGWLLNTGNLEQVEDLTDYPEIKSSVLNYGVKDLAGSLVSTTDLRSLEDEIEEAIYRFEPRLLPGTVKVRAVLNENDMSHNTLQFQIEGDMWSQPLPLQMYVSTVINLEDGAATISDNFG